MTLIYLMDHNQEVIEIVPKDMTLELWQDMGINEIDTLNGTMILSPELNDKVQEAEYVGIPDMVNKYAFNMYRLIKKEITNTEINIQGIQLGFDELASKGYVKDLRSKNEQFSRILGRILEGSGWNVRFVDNNLPVVNGNFYYMNKLEAIGELINLTGAELSFKVSISNNKVVDKYVEAHTQLGSNSGKRFTYGSNSLDIVAEENVSELYTAILGRGRGEEVSSAEDNPGGQAGFGRKITFEDVEWKKSEGNPVDKPKGQEFVEIPEATELFGYPDGSPRLLIKDYPNIEEPAELLNASFRDLVYHARPKVHFKTKVDNVGVLHVGDTVGIIRYDLDLKYQARVFKVKYNRLDLGMSEIELGDVLAYSNAKSQANFRKQVSREMREVDRAIENTYNIAADGTKVSYGPNEPENKRVNDIWYEELSDGTTRIRIWDGNQWVIEMSDIFGKELAQDVDNAIAEIDEVKQVADDAVNEINTAVENAGFTSLDDTISYINTVSNNAENNAQQAITDASNAFSEAQLALEGLDDKVDLSTYNTALLKLETDIDSAITAGNTAKETAEGLITQVEGIGTIADSALQEAKDAVGTANTAKSSADSLSTEVSGLKTDVEGFELTVNNYQDQVSQFSADVDGFQSTVASYETEVDEFGNIVSTNTTQVNELKNDIDGFESLLASYDEDLDGFNTTVSSFRNTLEGLESTVAGYETEVDEYGNEVATYATELSTLRNTVDGFESTVAEFDTTVTGYQTSLATLTNTVDGFESTVANYETQVDEYGNAVSSYATEVATLENTVHGFNSLVASFEEEAEGYSAEVSQFRNTVSGLQSTVASYEVELDEYGNVVDSYATQVATFNNTVNGLESTVSNYEQTVSGYATQLATLTNTVDGFNSTVTRYETQLDEYGNEVSNYATEVSTLTNTVDGLNSTVGNYQTELIGYRGDVTQYQNQVSTMQNTVDGFNNTVAQYTTEVDEFGNEVNAYATQVSTLENTVDGFNSTVSDFQYDLDNIEIGGRNLAHKGTLQGFGSGYTRSGDVFTISGGSAGIRIKPGTFEANTSYVMSFKFRKVSGTVRNMAGHASGFNSDRVAIDGKITGDSWSASGGNPVPDDTNTHTVEVYLHLGNSNQTGLYIQPNRSAYSDDYVLDIWDLQLEKGNKATDWTPAPEDMATASQVSSLTNTVDGFRSSVDKVESDYRGISGTVASHTSSISNMNGQIALKANTTTVNALTGRVNTAETGITSNANAIKLKASQSSVDTLSGRVNTLGSQLDVTAGQISSKVWMTDIDDIEIGGRNLIKDSHKSFRVEYSGSGEINKSYYVGSDILSPITIDNEYTVSLRARGNIQIRIFRISSTGNSAIPFVEKNELSETEFRDFSMTFRPHRDELTAIFITTGYNTGVSGWYEIDENSLKLEKGNIATDWTPAPEDTDAKINHVESELTQKHDSITASVSSIDGRVSAQKITLDSIVSTVSDVQKDAKGTTELLNQTVSTVNTQSSTLATIRTDLNGKATITQFNTLSSTVNGTVQRIGNAEGDITQIEASVKGVQNTVSSKASQSQVTQLANSLSSTVTAVDNIDVIPTDDGTGKTFRNVYSYTYGSSSVTGMIRLNTPIISPYMTLLRITGYNYRSNNSNIDLTISFYAYSNGTILNHSYSNKGDYKIDQVRVGRDSSGRVVVFIGRTNNNWSYVSINVETAKLSFNTPPDSYKNGWSATVTTSTSGISNLTTLNGMDMQSSITQNASNINLRVTKGDVISQINIEAGRTLIQSKKLLLNATNTVISGTTWMDGAVIKNASINGAKIANATIGSAKITSLDVSKITGNTSNFVQSNWNSYAGGNVRITGSGIITTASNSSQTLIQNGVSLTRQPNGATVGYIGYNSGTSSPFYSITTSLGSNFSIRSNTSRGWTSPLEIYPGSNETYLRSAETRITGSAIVSGRIELVNSHDLRMNNGNIVDPYGIYFNNGGSLYTTSGNLTRFDVNSSGIIQFRVGGTQKFRIDSSRNYSSQILNMQGNAIADSPSVSDYRMKDIYGVRVENDLGKLMNIEYVNFRWKDEEFGGDDLGFIAQQVQSIAPEIITESANGMLGYNSNSYVNLIAHSVQQLAIKHDSVAQSVDSHTDTIHMLQQELSQANRKIKELEEKMA